MQGIGIDWNSVITLRRSARSASARPTSVSSHTGAFIANEPSPIRNDDAPSVSSRQGSATCWAHVPMLESRLANQNVPKRRVASSPSDSRNVLITPEDDIAEPRHRKWSAVFGQILIRPGGRFQSGGRRPLAECLRREHRRLDQRRFAPHETYLLAGNAATRPSRPSQSVEQSLGWARRSVRSGWKRLGSTVYAADVRSTIFGERVRHSEQLSPSMFYARAAFAGRRSRG